MLDGQNDSKLLRVENAYRQLVATVAFLYVQTVQWTRGIHVEQQTARTLQELKREENI
jgi:hypothetical protein